VRAPGVGGEAYFAPGRVLPGMWEDYGRLSPPRPAAEILAAHRWPKLYDADRLRHNDVPVVATIYINDVYVERDYAMETAGLIRGLRPWITDEYEHNGIRADGERVLDRLLALLKGRAERGDRTTDRRTGRATGAEPLRGRGRSAAAGAHFARQAGTSIVAGRS